MARAPPSQRLAAVPEDDDKTLQWGLVDFLGKYHKHAIASDFPVPGSAVSRDELREAQYKAHIEGIRDRVNGIQARKGESVQEKVRHETFALKALIQKRVGSTLDRVGATLEGLPAARGASALLPLAVPLDKYLLREATARDAGFLEVRDKSTPEEQARQEALNRQRERLLAKRADDRHRARQRALEEAKATKEAERSSLMAEVLRPAS